MDAFRRCRGDVGKLSHAWKRVLHVRMSLGTRAACPIRERPVWVVIEIDDVSNATIDGKIAGSPNIAVPLAWRRPAEQINRGKIGETVDKTHDGVDSFLN